MNDTESKNYEISFLTKEKDKVGNILELLKKFGAEVTFEGQCEKIDLAYKIKKETSAYFCWANFALNPQKVKELREELMVFPDVLRFLIIALPQPKIKTKAKPVTRSEKISPKKRSPRSLSNKALEEKLEEILK